MTNTPISSSAGGLLDDPDVLRLAAQIRSPLAHLDRRIEHFDLCAEQCFRWHVTQQIVIPLLKTDPSDNVEEVPTLITLGLFSKARLPDLEITCEPNKYVSLLTSGVRAALLAAALISGYLKNAPPSEELSELSEKIMTLIIGQEETKLKQALASVEANALTIALKTHDPPSHDAFMAACRNLTRSTHILAVVHAKPGSSILVKYSFTDFVKRRPFVEELKEDWHNTNAVHGTGRAIYVVTSGIIGRVLEFFSMLPIILSREMGNINHTRSYYLLAECPKGLSASELYWVGVGRKIDAVQVEYQSRSHALGFNPSSCEIQPVPDQLRSDTNQTRIAEFNFLLQFKRLGDAALGFLLVVATTVTGFFANGNPEQVIEHSQEFAAIAGVPGVVIGLLSVTDNEFATWIARGLRTIGATLVVLVGLFVGVVATSKTGATTAIEHVSEPLASFGTFAAAILFWVAFVPRPLKILSDTRVVRLEIDHAGRRRVYNYGAAIWFLLSLLAAVWIGLIA